MLKLTSLKSIATAIAFVGAGFIINAQGNSSQAAGDNDYIGSIFATAANFCPRGSLRTNGQLIDISDNRSLFALLGTMYGGDGRRTFALPNLEGRSIISIRRGSSGAPIRQGELYGKIPMKGTGQLAMLYCIVRQGAYPSRN